MRYTLLLFVLLLSPLLARENPFFPLHKDDFTPFDSKEQKTLPPLKQLSITLPSTARTIESVTLRYKNLDGSVSEKKVDVERSIDWHLPVFISQSYQPQEQRAPQTATVSKAPKLRKVLTLSFVKFFLSGKTIYIHTQDRLLRSFLLVKPHRIVADFQRDTDLRSYVKKVKNSPFKSIRIGTHKGYYRVVIELDGIYTYTKQKTKNGYKFTLR